MQLTADMTSHISGLCGNANSDQTDDRTDRSAALVTGTAALVMAGRLNLQHDLNLHHQLN